MPRPAAIVPRGAHLTSFFLVQRESTGSVNKVARPCSSEEWLLWASIFTVSRFFFAPGVCELAHCDAISARVRPSAPLFGAAGSGYLNQGHLFEFTPRGSVLITGGAVGLEGSVYAYLAMLVALILLVVTGTDGSHLRGDGE
jgi:hypothetical protein